MKRIIIDQDEIFGPWVSQRSGGQWTPGRGRTIGLVEESASEETCLAGVIYEDCNGVNVVCHIAAVPGARWMSRLWLWAVFHYPFEQLKVRRITAVIAASNLASRRFVEHLGFKLEATLTDAHPTGDLLIYRLLRSECKWHLRGPNGKVSNASCSGRHEQPSSRRSASEPAGVAAS